MSKRHLYILTAVLCALGLGIFLYKTLILKFPLVAETQSKLWDIEVRLSFQAKNQPIKVSLFLPKNTRRYAIIDENFISQGFGFSTSKDDKNRKAIWSKRQAKGQHSLYYRGTVRRIEMKDPLGKNELPTPEMTTLLTGAKLEAGKAILSELLDRSADTSTFVTELTNRLSQPQGDQNLLLLLGKKSTLEKKLAIAVEILTLAKIPARIVHGIRLQTYTGQPQFVHWLQVFDKGVWKSHDPETGDPELPDDYFTWWRGSESFVELTGANKLEVTISIAPNQEKAIHAAMLQSQFSAPKFLEFSLFGLPLHTQAVYRVLLMVPLGALLLVILRNVIGVKTFGTFMPVLIALAFRETQLLWGIVLFSLVVALGLGVRFYLEHLKLLLVPRLAAILTIVVILMAILSILSHKLGLERGLSVALFPMVILTMTIERMCIVWEERGAQESIQQGLGSLAVATLTYLAMTLPYVEHLLFVFPELLFLLLAGTLLLGRYSGFRLLELRRFKALAQDSG